MSKPTVIPPPPATQRPPVRRVPLRELLRTAKRPSLYEDMVATDPMIIVAKP